MKNLLLRWLEAIGVGIFGGVGLFMVMLALSLHEPLRLVFGFVLLVVANLCLESFATAGGKYE